MSSKPPPVVFPTQSTIACDGCGEVFDVKWFCKHCSKSLCETCKARHDAGHKIVSRTGSVIRSFDSSKIIQPCPEHPEKELTAYCNDCRVTCCIKCIEKKHRRHDVVAIETKYMECEDDLNSVATDLKQNKVKPLQLRLKELKESLAFQEKTVDKAEKEVNRFRQGLKAEIDKSCDKLVFDMKQKQQELSDEIKFAISKIELNLKEIESFVATCGQRIREGGLDLIQNTLTSPPLPADDQPDISHDKPVFIPREDLMNSITQNVGEIKWEVSTKSPNSIHTEMVTKSGEFDAEKPIKEVKILKEFTNELSGETVVPPGKNTAWIASSCHNFMKLIDDTGGDIRSVSVARRTGVTTNNDPRRKST